MKHAAKDAELYLARCRKLEAQNAALLAALREVVDKCEMAASLAVIKRVALDAIAQVKGDTDA